MSATKRYIPLAILLVATALFALGPAVLKLLMLRGTEVFLDTPGAISFCNVLFVGNLCAGLLVLAYSGFGSISRDIRLASSRTKLYLIAGALVSTIYPALLFTALEKTTVINVVLLSRFNGIVYVVLAFFILRSRVPRSEALGYLIMAVGVSALVIANNGGIAIRTGDLLILAATLFFGITEIISKKVLPVCSVTTYMFVRNFCSAVIFFLTVILLFDFHHFADAFEGNLWILMVIYAGINIVLAQLLWLTAVKVLPVHVVADVQLVNPAFSLISAFILLGEVPRATEWLVMGVVAVGMLLPRFVTWGLASRQPTVIAIDTGLVAK